LKNKALIVFALMWNKNKQNYLTKAVDEIQKNFGSIILQSKEFGLEYSHYYEKEMGEGLIKKFVVFDGIIDKEDSVKIKKYSMELENSLREDGNRTVNIDPVYVDEYQVVALSHKDRGSRVYLSNGVYAEIQLLYHHGSFQPLLWSYLDYKENADFFNEVRRIYLKSKKTRK
jgi:hypothetical protein